MGYMIYETKKLTPTISENVLFWDRENDEWCLTCYHDHLIRLSPSEIKSDYPYWTHLSKHPNEFKNSSKYSSISSGGV